MHYLRMAALACVLLFATSARATILPYDLTYYFDNTSVTINYEADSKTGIIHYTGHESATLNGVSGDAAIAGMGPTRYGAPDWGNGPAIMPLLGRTQGVFRATFTFGGTDYIIYTGEYDLHQDPSVGTPYAWLQIWTDQSATTPTITAWALNGSVVPEPATYTMLFAGLGLMGFVARRRKQS